MLSIVLHGIVWYYMELLCILWYRIVFMLNRMVLHGIALYLTVLHGIALLALARGLYLARHLSTLYYDHQIVINNFPSLLYLKVCTLAACNSQLTALLLLLLHIFIANMLQKWKIGNIDISLIACNCLHFWLWGS